MPFEYPVSFTVPVGADPTPALEQLSKKLFLLNSLELPIDVLATLGISSETINLLNGFGLRQVQDLGRLDEPLVLALFPTLPERDILGELWRDILVEVAAKSFKQRLESTVSAVSTQSGAPTTSQYSEFTSGLEELSERPPTFSKGSAPHGTGECRPCAWYHHKTGCLHGLECEFCHMCPPGELRRRKKQRVKESRSSFSFHHAT